MKKFIISSLVLVMIISTTGCKGSSAATDTPASNAETTEEIDISAETEESAYKIIAAHANPDTHPFHIGLVKFGELLEEKSDGQISLDVFHSAQLGSDRDLVEGMQLNTVQASVITSAPLSGFTDAYLVFDLPFLFQDIEKARMVCDSDVGDEMLRSMEDIGILGLAFMENGMRNITNSKLPINVPEDLKGIKIRTMENPMHMAAFHTMGADPTPMAFGELFTAMQQKAIDAQENPFVVIYANKFYEVQDYLTITEHLYSPAPLLLSKTFYDSLPSDLQAVVHEAADEATVYQRANCDEQSAILLKSLEDAGMQVNYPDKAPFIEATQSVYDQFVGDGAGLVSSDTYNRVKALLEE